MSTFRATSDNFAYPPHFLADVRSRINLASLVGRDAKLERAGRRWQACCPFHADKTPSFTIYEDGHYHCFGCQAHGDAIDYVMQRDGLDFREAVAQLAHDAGIFRWSEPPPMSSGTTPIWRGRRPSGVVSQGGYRLSRSTARSTSRIAAARLPPVFLIAASMSRSRAAGSRMALRKWPSSAANCGPLPVVRRPPDAGDCRARMSLGKCPVERACTWALGRRRVAAISKKAHTISPMPT